MEQQPLFAEKRAKLLDTLNKLPTRGTRVDSGAYVLELEQWLHVKNTKEKLLKSLIPRLNTLYEPSVTHHKETLSKFWKAAFPEEELSDVNRISELWKMKGWHPNDPSLDFRGGLLITLESMLYFSETFPRSFNLLLRKPEGKWPVLDYQLPLAGAKITEMLIQMLDLEKHPILRHSVQTNFVNTLSDSGDEFKLLFCILLMSFDKKWLAADVLANNMDFNILLKTACDELENQLVKLDGGALKELPAYSLLDDSN